MRWREGLAKRCLERERAVACASRFSRLGAGTQNFREMMTMRRYVQAACVVSALAFATLAHADDAAMAEAQARFNEGLQLADNAKFEEARLKFLQAFAVLKAPAVLFNLASTEQKTGHDVEAIEHYRAFLKGSTNDTRITDAMRDKAKQNIAALLPKVGQVDIDAPDGAKLSVDGKPLEEWPKDPVPVTPGKHTIEAAFSGKVKSVTVDAPLGQVVKAKLDFDNATDGTYAPPETGSGGGWSTARIVTVSGLAAVAVTGGVLSLIFRSNAQDNVDEAKTRLQGGSCIGVTSTDCTIARQLKDDRDSNVTLSTVSLVGGAVFAAGAVAAAVFWPTSSERSARVVPVTAPGYGGFSLVGRF